MRNWLISLMVLVILGVNLWYFNTGPAEKLPMVKTEEVIVMEIQSPPGQIRQSITNKQQIAGILRYYNTAKVMRNSFGTTPTKKIQFNIFDGRIIGLWPLNSEMVGVGIKDKTGYKQYNVQAPELVDYFRTIPENK